jgi:hypothetical protein
MTFISEKQTLKIQAYVRPAIKKWPTVNKNDMMGEKKSYPTGIALIF